MRKNVPKRAMPDSKGSMITVTETFPLDIFRRYTSAIKEQVKMTNEGAGCSVTSNEDPSSILPPHPAYERSNSEEISSDLPKGSACLFPPILRVRPTESPISSPSAELPFSAENFMLLSSSSMKKEVRAHTTHPHTRTAHRTQPLKKVSDEIPLVVCESAYARDNCYEPRSGRTLT
jgi:hypothetical protein